uniref:Uncharacterized protein n=1 Tax=viral metagenome TaxID=1070528 RepID=A0A6M3KR07_9ZZZZ
MTDANLVGIIVARQAQLKLGEVEFAKRLGVSRATWFLIKKGERSPGQKFIRGILKAFPELQLHIYQYLSEQSK